MLTKLFAKKEDLAADAANSLRAIGNSMAIIEFSPDGKVISANPNFLRVMGYTLDEVKGQHHSMFVDPSLRDRPEYREFWNKLAAGEFHAAEFKRIGKGGREVWLQASYNPVMDKSGRLLKVVKCATDVTEEKLRRADVSGQIDAIGKSQAVIEFEMDGSIITANSNFLDVMGYSLDELRGQKHSVFVDEDMRETPEYAAFWENLRQGIYQAGEFHRIGKNGREVWIQASYNPILDMNGRPYKVVKFASDVTAEKLRTADFTGQIDAIGKAQAVIEFELDGTIMTANSNFLNALGYNLEEVKGRHHSMFVAAEQRDDQGYREFWERLAAGQYQAGEFKRIGKSGREVWIQASYNPILDMKGRPYKVVKFASDVTQAVLARKKAEHVRNLMENTAAGAEELNVSVREISQSMTKSREVADDTFNRAMLADQSTQRLDQAAKSMGGIIDVITEITGQINLLALNATIESARAGDAGKGFAVVANEVKNLATQARKATDEISSEVSNMLSVSTDVVAALEAIKQGIEGVREYVSSTAAAVEEQSVVANEMSASMQKAADEANAMGAAA